MIMTYSPTPHSGSIPAELGSLGALEELSLWSNKLTGECKSRNSFPISLDRVPPTHGRDTRYFRIEKKHCWSMPVTSELVVKTMKLLERNEGLQFLGDGPCTSRAEPP